MNKFVHCKYIKPFIINEKISKKIDKNHQQTDRRIPERLEGIAAHPKVVSNRWYVVRVKSIV